MAVFLPDIIGEYMDAPRRFHTGGVQYAGYFEPAKIAPEQIAFLYLFLQNTLNVPLTITLQLEMPKTKGFFSSKPVFRVEEPVIQLKLKEAEAGLLTLPVTTTEDVEAGQHTLTVTPKTTMKERGQRVRPAKSQSALSRKFIDSPVALNLVGTMGATFEEKSVKKAPFTLEIAGNPEPPERAPKLKYEYHVLWTQDQVELFNKAIQEINLRETKVKNELTVESLYANLYGESVARFAASSLPLRIGEAITLAKVLTYTCQFFLSSPNRRNGLLAPIWERALASGIDTTDTLELIRGAGYYHLMRVATMISFGIVAQAAGRHFWSLEERRAVTDHIAGTIEAGEKLDIEFLYLPLLMAGAHISSRLTFEGENVQHSLALLKKARDTRLELFTDPDMAQAEKIYDQILRTAA